MKKEKGLTYYCLDLETTGIMVGYAEIIELSIIRCTDRMQLSRTVRAAHPERAAYDALVICGKTLEDLKNGISNVELINDVDRFINSDGIPPENKCAIAHNAAFDRKFIHHLWGLYDRSFPIDYWLDTVPVCRRFLKARGHVKPVVKLGTVLDTFGLKKYSDMHSAKSDTRALYMLYDYLMREKAEYIDHIKDFPHNKKVNVSELMDEFNEEND